METGVLKRPKVVRKGLNVPLSIKKTQKKGWALFNGTQAIPAGHYVGSYVGEVLTATEADERERYGDGSCGVTMLLCTWHQAVLRQRPEVPLSS